MPSLQGAGSEQRLVLPSDIVGDGIGGGRAAFAVGSFHPSTATMKESESTMRKLMFALALQALFTVPALAQTNLPLASDPKPKTPAAGQPANVAMVMLPRHANDQSNPAGSKAQGGSGQDAQGDTGRPVRLPSQK